MQTDIDPRSLIGVRAYDSNGDKLGTVDEVYLDDATGTPQWAAVRTGLFHRDAFVPLGPSELADEGLRVPFERELIKDAPGFGVGRHLSPGQELQLYQHYGLALPPDVAKTHPERQTRQPERSRQPRRSQRRRRPPDRDFGEVAGSDD